MDLEVGDTVKVVRKNSVYEGVLMPTTTKNTVIKLDNGYNVGFDTGKIQIELLKKANASKSKKETPRGQKQNLPLVSILSTGGTIASRVDYRTGAVTSQFTAEDILNAIPELSEIARYNSSAIYTILSENMHPDNWIKLAQAVHEEIKNGAEGIIITHGTDTMAYTAAALSFMIQTPVPIVLVGSQRSADRPSSDNAMNAICASAVATSDIAEVCVVMHATTSDDFCHIHRGVKVRKMHTSRRDAFKSVNTLPIGRVNYKDRSITTFTTYKKRGESELSLKASLDPEVALIKYTAGASPEIIDLYINAGYRGIVIEGTGLGHVSSTWIPTIKRATGNGVPVVITSQCLNGRVCDRVYDTGRDMLKAGVIEGEDMLPEVALVKLMWTLGQTQDYEKICKIMIENLAGEITPCTTTSFQA
ncbi:MAG: Glu-tRNA(Gln) amidotransferase subunit GatD [Methanosarcinales archaeon]|nr:MAG: Glu-tRNA(Gln) amidotransferase subunit GatD [Methanosarcinales archaeon]